MVSTVHRLNLYIVVGNACSLWLVDKRKKVIGTDSLTANLFFFLFFYVNLRLKDKTGYSVFPVWSTNTIEAEDQQKALC